MVRDFGLGRLMGFVGLIIAIGLVPLAFLVDTSTLIKVGEFLVVADTLKPADAIVVLGGDPAGTRFRQAVDLVQQGFGRYLILDARDFPRLSVPAKVGVSLIVRSHSGGTLREAMDLVPVVEACGFRRLIVVTSPFHTRRARWAFRHVLRGDGVEVVAQPAWDLNLPGNAWWETGEGRAWVTSEYAKIVWYLLTAQGSAAGSTPGETCSAAPLAGRRAAYDRF